MKTSYTSINGIPAKLYEADTARGTVLAIHGFGGSKESGAIAGLAERVCPKGLNVLAFDLPAHGEREGGAEQLDPRGCIAEILAAEDYIRSAFDGDMYVFATSFGAMCTLHRLEKQPHSFKRIVLRVPAVNMSQALFEINKGQDETLTLEKAKEQGFRVTIGREYHIPYKFYESLVTMHCMRSSEAWNDNRLLVIYADKDELVAHEDTEKFLQLNPEVISLCIQGCSHRMPDPQHLAQALDAAAEAFLEV